MVRQFSLIEILFGVGFLGSTLLFLPTVAQPFELPKAWFFLSWSVVLIYGVIHDFLRRDTKKLWKRPTRLVLIPMLVWLGWAWYTGLMSDSVMGSILGNMHRLDGLFTISALVVIALIVSDFVAPRARHWLPSIILTSTAISAFSVVVHAFLVSVMGMVQLDFWHGAFGGIFGNPIFAAGYLAVTAPIVLYFYAHYEKDWIHLITTSTLFLIAVALFFTQAFGAIIALGLVGAVFLFTRKKFWQLGLVVLLVSLVILGFGLKNQRELLVNKVADNRVRIWQQLYGAWQEKPFVGWGWARTGVAFTSQPQPEQILFDIYVDKAHSHLVDMVVTTGVVGLILYVTFLLAVFVALILRMRSAESGSERVWWLCLLQMFCIYVVHTQTNVVSISEEVVFWTVVGLSLRDR